MLERIPISSELLSKRVLITGSSGFIGSYLRRAIPKADGIDRVESSTTNLLGDIVNPSFDVNGYDVIFHLAGIVGSETGVRNPIDTYKINVCGTINLVENFRGLFVLMSSAGVQEPLRNPYFLSKHVSEEIVRAAQCKHVIFRLANPYGVGSNSIVQKWLRTDQIQIYGDGNQTRDFVYIDDVIDVLMRVEDLGLNRTYAIGTGVPTSVNELLVAIGKVTGKTKRVEHLPARKFEIYEPVIKPDILVKTSLREGLEKCVQSVKS